MFASIGRVVWRDVGPTAVCFRLLMKARASCLPAVLLALVVRGAKVGSDG